MFYFNCCLNKIIVIVIVMVRFQHREDNTGTNDIFKVPFHWLLKQHVGDDDNSVS